MFSLACCKVNVSFRSVDSAWASWPLTSTTALQAHARRCGASARRWRSSAISSSAASARLLSDAKSSLSTADYLLRRPFPVDFDPTPLGCGKPRPRNMEFANLVIFNKRSRGNRDYGGITRSSPLRCSCNHSTKEQHEGLASTRICARATVFVKRSALMCSPS